MKIFFNILKVVSWGWTLFILFGVLAGTFLGVEGGSILQFYFILLILASPALIFLLWRYKEEKEIIQEKKKIKQQIKQDKVEKQINNLRKKEEERINNLRKKEEENNDDLKNKYNKPKKSIDKKIVGLILVCCLAIGGFTLSPNRKVKSLAKQEILSVLKAPSTAKFSNYDVEKLSNTTYTVKVNVDSENGFGASVRTRFLVGIAKKTNGYTVYDIRKIN